jgi:P27 family predicted phage terminase small subunit
MGVRGPAPTPTKILALRGSRRVVGRAGEPQPEVARLATPEWLAPDAKASYDFLADHLHELGLLTAIDQGALVRYATIWTSYRRCAEFVAKNGEVYPVRSKPRPDGTPGHVLGFKAYPQAKLLVTLSAELLRLEREFGLTPAARARLACAPLEEEDDGAAGYFSAPRASG